jgi:SARP family transcriptional regulator, regulator of embCAB operon
MRAAAGGQFEQASSHLSTALAEWRGPVLDDLRDGAGRRYPLRGAATRVGRLPDNDIILDDATVSRYHAMIVDTGNSFVITDLRSANGVHVADKRIRGSATLADGDRIRVSDHEFTFEIGDDN